MSRKRSFPRTQSLLLTLLLLGDTLVCYLGLTGGYLLRMKTPLRNYGIEPAGINFEIYQPLLWLGTLVMVLTLGSLGIYNVRLLLRPYRILSIVVRAAFFWLLAFLGVSLVLKFEPAVSRMFALLSCGTMLLALTAWRFAFFGWLSRSPWRDRMMQRVAYIGWTSEAHQISEAIHRDRYHPYQSFGVIETAHSSARSHREVPSLGTLADLETILEKQPIDLVIIADLDLPKKDLLMITNLCERRYVGIGFIPSLFQVFVSNLHMQTISGVPILSIDDLSIHRMHNRLLKRAVDILGALVGLIGALPIMAVLSMIIRLQSPGPTIYRQVRTGRNGQPFTIFKMRSMRLDAESGSGPKWAVENDPRRLPIGAFMREWNLDELPQFWNVLIGDMSLVGPRPERPELITRFEREIPHYNPRHEVRPGITGWAQVNGLRGNTSLEERIRFDLYYIENWSIWLDLQIMILTFVRKQNAY